MGELIGIVIIIGITYCMCKAPEWKSNNYAPPKGMKTDWGKASTDITLHGKNYFYNKHSSGGYNIPDKK